MKEAIARREGREERGQGDAEEEKDRTKGEDGRGEDAMQRRGEERRENVDGTCRLAESTTRGVMRVRVVWLMRTRAVMRMGVCASLFFFSFFFHTLFFVFFFRRRRRRPPTVARECVASAVAVGSRGRFGSGPAVSARVGGH